MEQLAGLDAAFLYCETPTMHMHVCGLLLLDPSTMAAGYSYEQIRSMVHDRLPTITSVRQKLAGVPFNLGRPFWIDDPDFDVDRHLHRVILRLRPTNRPWPVWSVTSPAGPCAGTGPCGRCGSSRDWPTVGWPSWSRCTTPSSTASRGPA